MFVGATESLQPDDTILGGSLTGVVAAQIAAAIFGVLAISGEYSTGTIRTTFTASPRRATVLAAKAVVVAGVTFLVALFTSFLAYEIGSLMLSGKGYAPGEPMPALVGIGLSFSASGLLGLAVGTILRHSAGAITAMIAIMLMPSLFGPLFGDLQRWVVGTAPVAAVQKLAQSSDAAPDVAGSLGAWSSLLILCAYSAAALMTGGWRLASRDA
ncbi:MAG: ABC transporter permease subunit [Actinomycetota bacterium]